MDLKSLQQQLKEVQKKSTDFKLSERTVVDLIQKIIKRGKVKLNYTFSGKEYVTDDKIKAEIQQILKSNGGIISKLELVKTIDLSQNIVEKHIDYLISTLKGINSITLIEGKLVSKQYLIRMSEEINFLLKENQGCLNLNDLTIHFDFTMNFFKDFIQREIFENRIKAILYPTKILTNEYVSLQKNRIRPILIASTQPITVSVFTDTFGIDNSIVPDLIKECISNGVKGVFKNNIYEPDIYLILQKQFLKGNLSQNSYIEYDKLKKVGIKDPKQFIKQNIEENPINGIFLEESYVDSSLKIRFETTFYDNFYKNKILNSNSIFDFELNNDDCQRIFENIKFDSSKIEIVSSNLIPLEFINSFILSSEELISKEATEQYSKYLDQLKEKEKKKKLMEEEQKDKDKDKKKKPKETKSKSKSKGNDEDDDEIKIELSMKIKSDLHEKLKKVLLNEEVNSFEETSNIIFDNLIIPKLEVKYKKALNELIIKRNKSSTQANSINDSENKTESLEDRIETDFSEIKLLQKSLLNVENVSSEISYTNAIKALSVNYCKNNLTNLFKNILIKQFSHMKLKLDLTKLSSHNSRKEIISSDLSGLDKEVSSILNQMNDFIQSKNLSGFVTFLENNKKNLAISILYDKKKEKQILEKVSSTNNNNLDSSFNAIGKTTEKKDYNLFNNNLFERLLLKANFYLPLPNESWTSNVYYNIVIILIKEKKLPIDDVSNIIKIVNDLLSLSENEFDNKVHDLTDSLIKLKEIIN